jgi:DNA modification methylase
MQCRRGSLPVLDMFGGTGTTVHVALKHGRDAS